MHKEMFGKLFYVIKKYQKTKKHLFNSKFYNYINFIVEYVLEI